MTYTQDVFHQSRPAARKKAWHPFDSLEKRVALDDNVMILRKDWLYGEIIPLQLCVIRRSG